MSRLIDRVEILKAVITGNSTPTTAPMIGISATSAQRWQLISANTITRLTDQAAVQNVLSNMLPAQSITLFVVANTVVRISTPSIDASNLHLTLNGIWGKNYAIETTTDFSTWTRQQTNTAPAASFEVTLPRPASTRFYRAVQLN